LLTKKGFEQKQQRLEQCLYLLHYVIPGRLRQAIQQARELCEDSQYRDVEMDKELLEAEVRRLEKLVYNAKIIANETISNDHVELGARVTLKCNLNKNKLTEVELVSPAEVDLEHGRISTQSPLGKLLLGKARGQTVTLTTMSKKITYKIVKIQHASEDNFSPFDS